MSVEVWQDAQLQINELASKCTGSKGNLDPNDAGPFTDAMETFILDMCWIIIPTA